MLCQNSFPPKEFLFFRAAPRKPANHETGSHYTMARHMGCKRIPIERITHGARRARLANRASYARVCRNPAARNPFHCRIDFLLK